MAYADVDEFLRRLGNTAPTPEQEAQAQEALLAAEQEIDSYLDRLGASPPTLTPAQAALVATVNYERAAEHLRLTPYGALNQGADQPPVLIARDGWYRHARKLASLRSAWGAA